MKKGVFIAKVFWHTFFFNLSIFGLFYFYLISKMSNRIERDVLVLTALKKIIEVSECKIDDGENNGVGILMKGMRLKFLEKRIEKNEEGK